jgi:hypothetical protein
MPGRDVVIERRVTFKICLAGVDGQGAHGVTALA